jgi:translation initiation factor IF-1
MDKQEKKVVKGTVTKALPNTMFRVETEEENEILCTLAGKMRINRIRVLPGDDVKVELNPYDEDKGRIVYRL